MALSDDYFFPFRIPNDVVTRAQLATNRGERILVTPTELIGWMNTADDALNRDADAEHDALWALRAAFSEVFEDPARRRQ